MSPSRFLTVLLLVVTALAALSGPAAAQRPQPAAPDAPLSAAFSYQGSLRSGSAPANGALDFQFILYDAASGGGQVGATVALEDVAVSNGNFTVALDFGAAAFDGQARWLQVGVRPGASTGAYSILSPRHALTAVPYALYATNAWSLTGNAGTTPGTNFLGTTDNQALELKVNSQRALRLEPATAGTLYGPNVIAGHSGNSVAAGQNAQTIAGGGSAALQCGASGADPCTNKVTNNYGTVGGAGATPPASTAPSAGAGRTPPSAVRPPSPVASTTLPAARLPPLLGAKATPPASAPPLAAASATPPTTTLPPSAEAARIPPAAQHPPSLGGIKTPPAAPMPSSVGARTILPPASLPPSAGATPTLPAASLLPSAVAPRTLPAACLLPSAGAIVTLPATPLPPLPEVAATSQLE